MKKIFGLALVLTLSLTSCKDYLTIVPSDAKFLRDVPALKQTLASYLFNYTENGAYNSMNCPSPWMSLMINSAYSQSYPDVWDFNLWNDEESLSESQKRHIDRIVLDHGTWSKHYSIVGYMNLILNEIDMAKGDDEMRNYVKGEALMHRAFSFFKLLQAYSPMDDAAMGIPLYYDTYGDFEDADLSRKNQKAVYDRILGDLQEVERLLTVTEPRTTYNVMYNYDHLYRIKAQVYLWKACGPVAEESDWENAAAAAKNAIEFAGDVLPWNVQELKKFYGSGSFSLSYPDNVYPEALLYDAGTMVSYKDYGYDIDLWKSLYGENDERKYEWFGVTGKEQDIVKPSDLQPLKKLGGWMMGIYKPSSYFRLGEQYLILAEAYAHTDFEEGKKVLRRWQSVRYKPGTESEWFVPANAEELIEEVLRERKREFLYEGDLMWLDMKRTGAADSNRSVAGYTATPLEANDFRYNFMIPTSETDTNPEIKRNPGWEDVKTI